MIGDIIHTLNYNINSIIELRNYDDEDNEKLMKLSSQIILKTLKSLERYELI